MNGSLETYLDPFARRIGIERLVSDTTIPADGRQPNHPAGLLAWGSHSGPPSRLRSGMMGLRPPIQLRGSAGISPTSRTPDAD
jgi:hypothetical protein